MDNVAVNEDHHIFLKTVATISNLFTLSIIVISI